jgi:hypothetical protein
VPLAYEKRLQIGDTNDKTNVSEEDNTPEAIDPSAGKDLNFDSHITTNTEDMLYAYSTLEGMC